MNLVEWKEKNKKGRRYSHFDNKVSLNEVWGYINNPEKVASHSFYPFIHYQQRFEKYSKQKGTIVKEREICYSAHIDRYIFSYYGFQLNQKYNLRAENDGISDSVVAYRDNLKKNNIDFAKKAISFIRDQGTCYILVGDFTHFFDNLDHVYMKSMLKELFGTKKLPNDLYAVYKNITKYSIWEMESILKLNKLTNDSKGIKILNEQRKVLSLYKFKDNKNKYVKKHCENIGIPQGSAISAVLSNIYMLDFDKKIFDFVSNRKGLYMRYSDDFILVFPKDNEEAFKEQFLFLKNTIESTPGLKLQPDKTKIFEYDNSSLSSCNQIVLQVQNGKNQLHYLGFSFDGNKITVRDKTITKYYYRLYRKLKTYTKNKGYTKTGKKINTKNIYLRYSVKGVNQGKGNFISYIKRAEKIFGKDEEISRGTKNHMVKIKRKLNLVKK